MVEETEGGSIRDAIKEAVTSSSYLETLEASQDDLGSPSPAANPAAEGEQLASGDDSLASALAEAQEGTAEEPPTSYWGTSLEGLSAEQRTAVIAALEQRDSTIQKLQQKLLQPAANEEPTPVPAEQVEPSPEITDDDLLRAMGIDPEGDPYEVEYARKYSLPLARQVMALEDTVERIQQTEEVRSAATYWNAEIDRLEAEYGKLPGDRVNVLQYAIDEGIGSPEILYFRLTAPARKAVESEVAKIRQEAAKKAAAGGLRPRATDGGAAIFDTEGLSLKETVRKAALAAQEESGYSWKDVLRGRAAKSS